MSDTPVQPDLLVPAESAYELPTGESGLRCVSGWLRDDAVRRLQRRCDDLLRLPGGGFRPRAESWLYGRLVVRPRDTVWMSENFRPYSYGGGTDESIGWPTWIQDLAAEIARHPAWCFSEALGVVPNVALLNVYRDGRDHVDWHADDEPEIDQRSPIASVSLGALRKFRVRRVRPDASEAGVRKSVGLPLGSGSLLVMAPGFQADWEHRVPPAKSVGRRWNLTFRVYGGSP